MPASDAARMSPPDREPFYTSEYVIARLEFAGRALLALPNGGCAPAAFKSNWPEFARLASEAYGYTDAQIRPAVPRARSITEMDEAFAWVGLVDHVMTRRLLVLRSLVHPITDRHLWPWRRLDAKFGIHRDTLKRQHRQGIGRIVTRLNDPAWRPPPGEGSPHVARPRLMGRDSP